MSVGTQGAVGLHILRTGALIGARRLDGELCAGKLRALLRAVDLHQIELVGVVAHAHRRGIALAASAIVTGAATLPIVNAKLSPAAIAFAAMLVCYFIVSSIYFCTRIYVCLQSHDASCITHLCLVPVSPSSSENARCYQNGCS